jgi:type IV secretory pathway TrbF-like protein
VPANLTAQPDVTAAAKFVSQTQLPWTNVTLGKDDWERFAVELVPYLLVVDRQGNIRELAARVQSLKDRLPELLK